MPLNLEVSFQFLCSNLDSETEKAVVSADSTEMLSEKQDFLWMIWMSRKQMNATCKELQELLSEAVYENTVAEGYSNIDSHLE